MKVDTFACDMCQTVKQSTNHWLIGSTGLDCTGNKSVNVAGWPKTSDKDAQGFIHLCGITCATQWVARELAK